MSKTVLLIRNIWKDAYGGAEKYQIDLAKILVRNNINPIIVSSSRRVLEEAENANLKCVSAPYCHRQNWSGWRNILLPFFVVWEIYLYFWYRLLIKKTNADVLHIQSRDDMIAGTLVAKKTGKKVVWTDHSDLRLVVWENIDKKYKNPIGKYIFKIANIPYKITTISQYEYDFINKIIPHELNNFIVIKNGTFDDERHNEHKAFDYTVGHIGRIVDYKGIEELIRAFDIVCKKYPKAKLLIYGDDSDAEYFKSLSDNERIKFMGYISDPIDAYSKIDVFVLASYHEGLSLSLIDAAMMNKAIIATDVDGNPEIVIDNKTGLLVPMKNYEALAETLDKLFANAELREKLANNARKHYEKSFNFEKIVKEEIIPLYE
ncbi:MAG: glycosyltransferase family 4 protein [Ruminococcus sp.]